MRLEVEINLYDVLTADLISELRSRRCVVLDKNDPEALIAELKSQKCPEAILRELEEWANVRVVTQKDLIAWKEFCRK